MQNRLICYFFYLLAGGACLWALIACKGSPCLQADPVIQVRVTSPTSQTLTNLTIIDLVSSAYTIKRRYTLEQDRQALFVLPLNLNARQTRYTFTLNGKSDTLTINYALKLTYGDQECGYTVDIDQPNGLPIAESTIGTVQTALPTEPAFADTLYGAIDAGYQKTVAKIRLRL
ncbi:hypothetical protein A6C57_09440 [Fibrella sp. ES10-3-2-2]|nr:hypothetical protein A6C57_09440 [Fibrella sp. ES10-3-2-2]